MWIFLTTLLIVFVVALFRYPRQTLYVVGGLIGLAAVAGLYVWVESARSSREREARAASVTVDVIYDASDCPSDYPLRAIITNKSNSVVNRVNWRYTALFPGRSTNLMKYEYLDSGTSDRILQPKAAVILCYKVPELKEATDPAKLEWKTTTSEVVFASD